MVDWFNNFQSLRQEKEGDCGVCVFGKLAGIEREEILRDLPGADEAKVTVDQWEDWLRSKGFDVTRYPPDEKPQLPCAHLVQRGQYASHWIYQDERGIHDPDPSFAAMPPDHPDMLDFSAYMRKLLSISIKRCDADQV
jgi:hypothetical protein